MQHFAGKITLAKFGDAEALKWIRRVCIDALPSAPAADMIKVAECLLAIGCDPYTQSEAHQA